jgi:alpha-beta hydrolase superfamily lysophospholipase
MMKLLALLFMTGLSLTIEHAGAAESTGSSRNCPPPWQCSETEIVVNRSKIDRNYPRTAKIRSGFIREDQAAPFRGNVIYYEGLGDSMLNHLPLFNLVAKAGYRVIAFDYMGQGGSSGSMNDTRILGITEIGSQIWLKHARDLALFPKKTIIGWSTGGLAAYAEAALRPEQISNLVLIAPGLAPNMFVGENNWLRGVINRITLSTLTSARYENGTANPHIDPISPPSPLDVWSFALDLIATAYEMRRVPLVPNVNGFVLLSGPNDTYVDAERTRFVLERRAPHFKIIEYPRALHEIDNEAEPTGSTARHDILDFILRN